MRSSCRIEEGDWKVSDFKRLSLLFCFSLVLVHSIYRILLLEYFMLYKLRIANAISRTSLFSHHLLALKSHFLAIFLTAAMELSPGQENGPTNIEASPWGTPWRRSWTMVMMIRSIACQSAALLALGLYSNSSSDAIEGQTPSQLFVRMSLDPPSLPLERLKSGAGAPW